MTLFEVLFAFLIACQWAIIATVVRQNNRLKRAHRELLNASIEQLRDYAEFRAKFEAYRARYDPIDTTVTGNVITIERGKTE